jgi:hypothetical protein
MLPALHTSAAVFYRASVIDAATGREVVAAPRKKNLILDYGLDLVASERWQDCIRYAVAGTGTANPTRRDSGAVTFTRAVATVTASAGFFVPADVGRLLKFNSGSEMKVTGYTSATVVTVSASGVLAASAGTIWYVNQTGLDAETVRTQTYGTGGTDNLVTLDVGAGQLIQKRTFIFPAETGAVTYREVGWSNDGTPGNNLFGRDVLAAPLALVAGQQLKIVLELTLTLDLLAPEAANTLPWAGGTAQQQIENVAWGHAFNPSQAGGVTVFVSESTDAFLAPTLVETPIAGTNYFVASTAPAYTPGSFTRSFNGYFGLNEGNSAVLRSAGFGWAYYTTIFPVVRVRFSADQTKDTDHSLRIDFAHTWGRTLAN